MCPDRRLGHNRAGGRRGGNGRTRFRRRRRGGSNWRLGNDWPCGRLGGNGGRLRRFADDGRGWPRLRNNPARGRLCNFRFGGGRGGCSLWSGRGSGFGRSGSRGARSCGCCGLLLLLLQDGLQNIARLGYLRQVDLGFGRSFGARTARRGLSALEMGAHTRGLVFFKRTGVCLLLGNANGFENIENGPALYFQFTC